ncbi:MAG: hypothetical protein DMF70_03135, partial [Acidobacteria bacterium]
RRAVKREFLGYQVSKTIAVILRDISRFDSLLSDVLKAGVTRLSNVEFRDSQLRRHRDQARAMAMKAAQEKASLLAREIGQSIGPAYSITEGSPTYDSTSNISQNRIAGLAGSSERESESAIAPGSIAVTQSGRRIRSPKVSSFPTRRLMFRKTGSTTSSEALRASLRAPSRPAQLR